MRLRLVVGQYAGVHYGCKCSQYGDSLLAGQSGDQIPAGGKIFGTCPDQLRGPLSLLYNGYRAFPGVLSGQGVALTTHPI